MIEERRSTASPNNRFPGTEPTWAGLAWRAFDGAASNVPLVVLVLLVLLVFWQAASSGSLAMQLILDVVLLALVGLTYALYRKGRLVYLDAEAYPPFLCSDLRAGPIDPEPWIQVLRLAGGTARVRALVRVLMPDGTQIYEACPSLSSFALRVARLGSGDGEVGETQAGSVEVVVLGPLGQRIVEQALFLFRPVEGGGLDVRVSIGYDMPRQKRQPLLERVVGDLCTIPGVSVGSPDEAPAPAPPEAIDVSGDETAGLGVGQATAGPAPDAVSAVRPSDPADG